MARVRDVIDGSASDDICRAIKSVAGHRALPRAMAQVISAVGDKFDYSVCGRSAPRTAAFRATTCRAIESGLSTYQSHTGTQLAEAFGAQRQPGATAPNRCSRSPLWLRLGEAMLLGACVGVAVGAVLAILYQPLVIMLVPVVSLLLQILSTTGQINRSALLLPVLWRAPAFIIGVTAAISIAIHVGVAASIALTHPGSEANEAAKKAGEAFSAFDQAVLMGGAMVAFGLYGLSQRFFRRNESSTFQQQESPVDATNLSIKEAFEDALQKFLQQPVAVER